MTRKEQVEQLADELGVPILPGTLVFGLEDGNAAYDPETREVYLSRDPAELDGYASAMHELGHANDHKSGSLGGTPVYAMPPKDVMEAEIRAWEYAVAHAIPADRDHVRQEAAFALGAYVNGLDLGVDGYNDRHRILGRLNAAAEASEPS